ncbi:MAG: alkaline phosphatase family protein [Planctomycetota bacterium]|nr:MAG: alkaline phosphatase family protein [Planctomycetota bacterium]
MKTRKMLAAIAATCLLAARTAWCAGTDQCVILISVDGLAHFYLDDPKAHMPFIRALAERGARADGMVCSFPTVTWPNHTTLVTGVTPARHGVLGNNYLDRSSGEKIPLIVDPLFDKEQLVRVPTIYDVAHRAGLTTAAIIWPATRNARTLDFTVPDMFGNDSWRKFGTRTWLDELRTAGIPVDQYGTWVRQSDGGIRRDWMYTRMADHLFRHHPPNLLLIHLVEVDHVQHRYGPRSPDAYWAVSFADQCVRDIVEASRRSPFGDKTTVIVTSDHGFFPIEKDICPNVLLKKEGLIEVADNKVRSKAAWCVSQGGACMVYVLDPKIPPERIQALKRAFEHTEGIEAVFEPKDFGKLGQATPEQDPRAPDLWLAAKSGYSFSETITGDKIIVQRGARAGTHGYLPEHPDMLGTLVISGFGVREAVRLGRVSNLDVAPTMAELLGLQLKNVQGRVLTKILRHAEASTER